MPFEHEYGDSAPEINTKPFTDLDVRFDDIAFLPKQGRVYVYVIVCIGTTKLKVGVSGDPRRRKSAMQTGCPFPLRIAHVQPFSSDMIALQVESRMHFLMGNLNKFGEWFDASIPATLEALDKSAQQVRNRRGELGYNPSLKNSVNLGWDYSA